MDDSVGEERARRKDLKRVARSAVATTRIKPERQEGFCAGRRQIAAAVSDMAAEEEECRWFGV